MSKQVNIDALLSLAARESDKRVFSVELDGETYWIKRCGFNDRPWRKKLHRTVNLLPLPQWAKPVPFATGKEAVQRETKKIDAFRASGFLVPEYVYADDIQIIFKVFDGVLGRHIWKLKAQNATTEIEHLLINAASTLGRIHAAGLCHGRPNIKDMFVKEGTIGFFDFKEDPEIVMPLEVAQARDCWLLFLFLCDQAPNENVTAQALENYATQAPQNIWKPLSRIVKFWHPIARIGKSIKFIDTGSEMRRIIKSDAVLYEFVEHESHLHVSEMQ